MEANVLIRLSNAHDLVEVEGGCWPVNEVNDGAGVLTSSECGRVE
jgi:hypothetical protein